MDPIQVFILLLHPLAALLAIREFVRQRGWRTKSIELKGAERVAALERHVPQHRAKLQHVARQLRKRRVRDDELRGCRHTAGQPTPSPSPGHRQLKGIASAPPKRTYRISPM